MIRPDPSKIYFVYRGGGGYYFVDLEVVNAYLYPI